MSNSVVRTLVTTAVSAVLSTVVVALVGLAVPFLLSAPVLVFVAVAMGAYGLFAGILGSYDLTTGLGWLTLLIDVTWSLPSTLFGAVVANLIYPIFGTPSRSASAGQHWIAYLPRSSSGFGSSVLQTVGTVNLGGAGQHERMHLLQHRIFGPAYLPVIVVSYVVTGAIQLLFLLPLGLILWATKVRDTPYLRPPSHSAVPGLFGWIYYATPFEVWAYASGNP
ncbi:MAG: hypothetical protein U0Q15_00200 [Kineosporiaceae bacterium]